MNLLFITIFIITISIYGGLTYYIGYRGLQFFIAGGLNISLIFYWIIIGLIAFSFVIGRLGDRWLPNRLSYLFETIGVYWFGIMTYLIMILFIGEILVLLNKRIQFIPVELMNHPKLSVVTGLTIISLIIFIVLLGRWGAQNPQIVEYEVTLEKSTENYKKLNIVMLSDLHLGKFVNRKQLENIVHKINPLNPDIIVIPGDIIDDRVDTFVEQNMTEVFQELNPKLGIYASFGNHEYIGGQVEIAEEYFQQAGINVLRDKYVKIADGFYLVGREDKTYERFKGKPRKELEELLKGIDKKLPIIMLDHQPVDIDKAELAGVDMQLSGHTHKGQLFPFGMITKKLFTVDWGYKKINNIHVIVSSGAGTWGPPMRVGNRSEIVYIKVQFE